MRGLAQRTGQSCHLAVLDDTFIRVIARQESFADLSFSVRVGTHAPVFQSCSGNVLYAFADEAARGQILDRVARGSDTALDVAAINRRAASIREQGWYAAKSSKTVGITDIGYPVFDHRGTVSAVLAIPYLDRLDIDSIADQELDAVIAVGAVAVMLHACHQVVAQRIDIDAVECVEPDQKVVLHGGRAARPGGPVPQGGAAAGSEGVDELVGFAGLHHLATLDVATVAQPRQFPVDLLVIGLPEEADRGIECLG
eukprot:gene36628-biopygen24095